MHTLASAEAGGLRLPIMTTATSRQGPSIDVALLGILLVALGLRLWYITTPLVDAHSWRQVTNADIARHFAEDSLDILHPRVSWGGRDGVVGMEFPLLHWITGVAWRLTGESAAVARLVTTLFSLAGVVSIFGLGARLFGRPAGLGAAWLMAVSPSIAFFGRSFLSDTPMLTFMVAAVWAWDAYFERPSTRRAVWASIFTALAALVKLPAILVLAPVVGVAWRHQRWRALADRRAWAAATAALVLIAGWYWHADQVFLETGLTQAVFRPSGTYPASVAPGAQFSSVSHWATTARLTSVEFWRDLGDRFWQLHLTAIGAAGALLGWLRMRRETGRVVVDLWLLGGLALFVAAAEGQYWHEFHQLPLLPPLLLSFGVAAGPIFDPAWRNRELPNRLAHAGLVVLALLIAMQGIRVSGVELNLYRPDNLQTGVVALGDRIRGATSPEGLIVTVEYGEYGVNSPMLLYFAHRRGWSFDLKSISGAEVEWLRTTLGARYLAVTNWHDLNHDKPDVAAAIEVGYKEIPLVDTPSNSRLFDLTQAR